MSEAVVIPVLLVLVGFVLSALYSGLETGIYTLNRVRLALGAAQEVPAALRLRRELRRPQRLLTMLLIGTNASNYLGTYGLAVLLHGTGLEGWTLVAVEAVIITPLLFVLAETLPKDLFRTYTDHWTYLFSPAIVWTRWLLTACLLLPTIEFAARVASRATGAIVGDTTSSRQRISQLIKEGVGAGVLTERQTAIADRVLALRGGTVEEVMVAWKDVVRLPAEADRAGREAVIQRRNFTRIPVVDRDGRVIGVLSWVDALLRPHEPTATLVEPALVLAPTTTVSRALSVMRHERCTIAVVARRRDERPLGIVTLKDLVEPLTGELPAW